MRDFLYDIWILLGTEGMTVGDFLAGVVFLFGCFCIAASKARKLRRRY